MLASAAGAAGWTADQVKLCYEGSLNPAQVTGKIVVCDRGVTDRVAKEPRRQAGRRRQVNTSANSLNADPHSVRRWISTTWTARRSRRRSRRPRSPRSARSPAALPPRRWPSSNRRTSVRSPIAVRPVALAAPAEVAGNGSAHSYDITYGYTGPFSTTVRGLLAATVLSGSVSDDPTNTFVVGGPGISTQTVAIPAGTTYARFALYDDQVGAGNDLDLYVYNSDGDQVGVSGTGTSNETVNLKNPAAGTYKVYVHGWQTAGGGTTSYQLFTWNLAGAAAPTNMTATVAPPTATTAGPATVSLSFTGLAAGTRYLGAVDYHRGATPIGTTIVYEKTP